MDKSKIYKKDFLVLLKEARKYILEPRSIRRKFMEFAFKHKNRVNQKIDKPGNIGSYGGLGGDPTPKEEGKLPF